LSIDEILLAQTGESIYDDEYGLQGEITIYLIAGAIEAAALKHAYSTGISSIFQAVMPIE
jgi:hypothetical protein